jgi:hypothetical protein
LPAVVWCTEVTLMSTLLLMKFSPVDYYHRTVVQVRDP